jgi:hypothetical protein
MAERRTETPRLTARLAQDNKSANRVELERGILKGPPTVKPMQVSDRLPAKPMRASDQPPVKPVPPTEDRVVGAATLSEEDQADTTEVALCWQSRRLKHGISRRRWSWRRPAEISGLEYGCRSGV